MAISLKRFHVYTAALSAPPCSKPRPRPLPQTPGHSGASPGQPFLGSLLLSPGSQCTQSFVCALQESASEVLCKFWWFYGGVNGNLLQEGLCHTQICCMQSPCPWGRPLLTHTSTGDTQTQFWLSLCGVAGFWCAGGLFGPSECLWWVWGLILNVIFPSYHLSGASPLPLDVGCLLKVRPTPCSNHSSATQLLVAESSAFPKSSL